MAEIFKPQPVIMVHGGAGNITNDFIEQCKNGIKEAAVKGYRLVCSLLWDYYNLLLPTPSKL